MVWECGGLLKSDYVCQSSSRVFRFVTGSHSWGLFQLLMPRKHVNPSLLEDSGLILLLVLAHWVFLCDEDFSVVCKVQAELL